MKIGTEKILETLGINLDFCMHEKFDINGLYYFETEEWLDYQQKKQCLKIEKPLPKFIDLYASSNSFATIDCLNQIKTVFGTDITVEIFHFCTETQEWQSQILE